VIGAASAAVAEIMAETLAGLPIRRAFVIHGAAGWDEATPIGTFGCYDVEPGRVTPGTRDPSDYGLAACSEADLAGGDAEHNAARLRDALSGGDSPAHRDALALGAGLALEVTGRVDDLGRGIEQARAALADGRARALLDRIETFAVAERDR
jgi:anthranilate phosphoribosyltransferase